MISIIIAAVNEADLQNTINSIRAASDKGQVEIVVVDDCSSTKIKVTDADCVIHNRYRCGCGPSREIGALYATHEWMMIVDAHERFSPDWYEKLVAAIAKSDQSTVYCCACAALDKEHPTLESARTVYRGGATLNLYGRDPAPGRSNHMQVFEATWQKKEIGHGVDIPCLMGACYVMQRDFFHYLSPLRHLRYWGGDEQLLSIKTWLAGGSIKMLPEVVIGHRFWGENERQGFTVPKGYPLYNKAFCCHTLLPPELAETLVARMGHIYDRTEYTRALDLVKENWYLIEYERRRNASIFTRDFNWYAERFGIPLPGNKA
jgi:glycosyltransferase involved in cell wall biosynthesis